MKSNLLEICDTKYSLRCKFDSDKAVEVLKEFVGRQPVDINILGLLGKELHLQEALLSYDIKPVGVSDPQPIELRISLLIRKFTVLSSFWDCKVPPKLVAIEDEQIIKLMMAQSLQVVQRKKLLGQLVSDANSAELTYGHVKRAKMAQTESSGLVKHGSRRV